jgi:uncharacterized membrane protein YphA (DoxX/SURF4 family)
VTPRERSDSTNDIALRLAVAFAFVVTGADKFIATDHWVPLFDAIGAGQWFRVVTGIVETVGGLLFLVPAATVIGAAMLIATMTGAMLVHIVIFRHPGNSLFPAVYLAGVIVAFLKLQSSRRAALSNATRH